MPQGHSPLSALVSPWEAASAPAWSRSGALGSTAVGPVLLRVLGGPARPPPPVLLAMAPWKGPPGVEALHFHTS